MSRKYLIVGSDDFSLHLSRELFQSGYEVVVLTKTSSSLFKNCCSQVLNVSLKDYLSSNYSFLNKFDSAVFSLDDLNEEVYDFVSILKQAGIGKVILKSNISLEEEPFYRAGVDEIIYPAAETGRMLARKIDKPGLFEFIAVEQDSSILEIKIPVDFIGKSLLELDLRRKYNITVVAISHSIFSNPKKRYDVSPNPDNILHTDDILVIIGDNKDLRLFKNSFK